MKKILIAVILTLFAAYAAYAEESHSDSLSGLSTVRAVIDLNQGKANLLDLRLVSIRKTFESLKSEGVKPVFIVVVRGDASAFMAESDKYISSMDTGLKKIMHKRINELRDMGVRFQQCGLSLAFMKIDQSEIINGAEIVKNGYISLAGYQNKGYALLSMD
ncbi:MAG: DsrE family protein [Deferribacterales bacterium]